MNKIASYKKFAIYLWRFMETLSLHPQGAMWRKIARFRADILFSARNSRIQKNESRRKSRNHKGLTNKLKLKQRNHIACLQLFVSLPISLSKIGIKLIRKILNGLNLILY